MDVFPAQYSTLSTSALNNNIQQIYGFANLSCRLLVRNVSDVYLLEHDNERFIFKIYRKAYRTLDEIKGEAALINILKQGGISVSYPILDLAGNHIQEFNAAEGIRYGILFTFAKRKVIPIPDDAQLAIIGRTIARMHNITSTIELPYERITYNTETTITKPLALIKNRFSGLEQEYHFLKSLAEKLMEKLDQYDTYGSSYGYCHYDLLPKNFHFDEDNNITFFDFDWAGKGLLVNDLMTFFVQLFFLVHFNAITKEEADDKMAKVIAGYREVRALPEEELALIPYLGIMFWIHAFGFYEQNCDDFATAFLTPRFIKERVSLIGKWVEWYCKF